MPYWAELENEGFVQLADPVVTGAVEAGLLADGVGPPEVGAWLADGAADADFDADLDADGDGDALWVRDLRDARFGMTATRGVAAACGRPAAATLAEPVPAEACREMPSSAAAPTPLPGAPHALIPPAATRAHAATTPTSPRREGGNTRRRRDSVPRVPASSCLSLAVIGRTRHSPIGSGKIPKDLPLLVVGDRIGSERPARPEQADSPRW